MKKILIYNIIVAILILGVWFSIFKYKENKEKKLVFWSIQLKPIYETQMNRIIKEFESLYPQYKVVWVDIPIQEAQKRTLASILSSTPPDLVNLNPDFSILLAQKNALHIFNENDVEQFHPSLVEKLKYGGKIYALPYYATSPVTIYNKEIYNKCISGNFIKYYSELNNIYKKLNSCHDIAIFSGNINENDTFSKLLNKYNIDNLNSENNISKTKEIYSLFNKLYKNNALPKDILSINHRENIEKYMSNQALIIVAGSNFINIIKQNAPEIYSKSEISSQLLGSNEKFDVSLMNLIIPSKAKNQEGAIIFAKMLTNKTNQLEFAKLTNVLPANKYTLEDEYFKNCSNDLYEKSRCISVNQLKNINTVDFESKNKKQINEEINKTLEEILLDGQVSSKDIDIKINELSAKIKLLQ